MLYPGAGVIGVNENVGVNEGLHVRANRRDWLAVPTPGRSLDSKDAKPAALPLRNPDLVRPAFLTVPPQDDSVTFRDPVNPMPVVPKRAIERRFERFEDTHNLRLLISASNSRK